MSAQAMLMITVVLLSLIYQGNSQSCTYLFRNIAPNHERDYSNSAYKKGEYSSVLYCGKFCARDTNCAGFVRFRDPQRTKQGKIACVFVNTYSTGKDVFENVHADYFQRETIGLPTTTINSAQFYASDSKLVVNTDSHALVYKITDVNGEKGISATLEATLPLSSMYEYWDDPPQASFTIPDVTFLVSGQKQQCFNKISFTRYEKCKEDRSYTFFEAVFETTEGFPLDAVVSFPDVLYVFSRNLVFYLKKTSSEKDQNVVYTATQKAQVDDPVDWNKWTNIPSGYTAITMVDEKVAVVFTGNKYHLYDTATKSILTDGFLHDQGDGCQTCNTECKTVKPTNTESEAVKPSNTESEAMKQKNTESEAVKPTNTESEAVKPTNNESEAVKPTNTESEAVKPTNTESETVKPTNTESEAVKPTNTESEAVKPSNTESEAVKPTNTESEAVKPTNTESETVKPTNTESEAVKPTNTESEAVKPSNTESEAVKPTYTESEAVKPTNTESEAVKPSNTESEAVKPTYTESEAVKPTNTESETVKPTNTESEAVEPTNTESEAVKPTNTESEAVKPTNTESEAVPK